MRVIALGGALLLASICASHVAEAKSAAWLRHDREVIRQLNRNELARVRRRDAQYATAARRSREDQDEYVRSRAAYERELADYSERRRQYRDRLADWRKAVAACRAGVRSACD